MYLYIIGDNTSVKMTELVEIIADILKVPAPKKHITVFVITYHVRNSLHRKAGIYRTLIFQKIGGK